MYAAIRVPLTASSTLIRPSPAEEQVIDISTCRWRSTSRPRSTRFTSTTRSCWNFPLVGRFDVPVHDAHPVRLCQRVCHGQPEGMEPAGGQLTAGGHMLLGRGSLEELADDAGVLSGQIGVEDARGGEFTDPARRAELPAYAGERDLAVLHTEQQELHHDLPPRPVPGKPHHSLSAPAEFTLADVSARQPLPRIHAPAPSPAPDSWPSFSSSATPGPDRRLGQSRMPRSDQLPVSAGHFSPGSPTPVTTHAVTTSEQQRFPPCAPTNTVASNRVAEAVTTSPRDHHPVHIKEVRR